MSGIASRVQNLGKLYRIGAPQNHHATLRDALTDAFARPFRRIADGRQTTAATRHSITIVTTTSGR